MEKGRITKLNLLSFGPYDEIHGVMLDLEEDQVVSALNELCFSTSEPERFDRHDLGMGIKIEEQEDDVFRIEVDLFEILIEWSPRVDWSYNEFSLLLVMSDGRRIVGTRQDKRYVFENVPPGEFRIENRFYSAGPK